MGNKKLWDQNWNDNRMGNKKLPNGKYEIMGPELRTEWEIRSYQMGNTKLWDHNGNTKLWDFNFPLFHFYLISRNIICFLVFLAVLQPAAGDFLCDFSSKQDLKCRFLKGFKRLNPQKFPDPESLFPIIFSKNPLISHDQRGHPPTPGGGGILKLMKTRFRVLELWFQEILGK